MNVDIHELIDEVIEKKNIYLSIYIGETGTSINIYPKEESLWKPMVHKNKIFYECPECHRPSEESYPVCPWCGNSNGFGKEEYEKVCKNIRKETSETRKLISTLQKKYEV